MAQVKEFNVGDVLLGRGGTVSIVARNGGENVPVFLNTVASNWMLCLSPIDDDYLKIGHLDGQALENKIKEVYHSL